MIGKFLFLSEHKTWFEDCLPYCSKILPYGAVHKLEQDAIGHLAFSTARLPDRDNVEDEATDYTVLYARWQVLSWFAS